MNCFNSLYRVCAGIYWKEDEPTKRKGNHQPITPSETERPNQAVQGDVNRARGGFRGGFRDRPFRGFNPLIDVALPVAATAAVVATAPVITTVPAVTAVTAVTAPSLTLTL